MSRLAVIGSPNFSNENLIAGLLDVYVYDDPDMVIAIHNVISYSPESCVVAWANNNNIEYVVHPRMWAMHSGNAELMLRSNIDLICDADEVLVFWDGIDEHIVPSLNIAQGQGKTQVVVISNDDVDCEIYDGEEE